jgi:hypothetical protein
VLLQRNKFEHANGTTLKFKRDQWVSKGTSTDFMDKLDRFSPKHGQIALPFPYEPDPDDGKGMY